MQQPTKLKLLTACLAFAMTLSLAGAALAQSVATPAGEIVGTRDGDLALYQGIPYAKPRPSAATRNGDNSRTVGRSPRRLLCSGMPGGEGPVSGCSHRKRSGLPEHLE